MEQGSLGLCLLLGVRYTLHETFQNVHSICFYLKQDRQCTYNVTLRRVRVTIVAVEKQ
jgi:hypothetical protein